MHHHNATSRFSRASNVALLQSGIGSDCIKRFTVITIDGTSTKQGGNAAKIRGVGYSNGQSTSSGFKGAFRDAFGVAELVSNSFSSEYILSPLLTDIYKLAAEKQL